MIDSYHFDKTPEDLEREALAEDFVGALCLTSSETVDLQGN